jgi:pentatricopeptide repeat protein
MLKEWQTITTRTVRALQRTNLKNGVQRRLVSWRATFDNCENPNQLRTAFHQLFAQSPRPHQRTLVQALEACSRLAENISRVERPTRSHTNLPSADRLDAYLLSLDQPLAGSYDRDQVIQLAQNDIIGNIPSNRMTAPVYASYLSLLAKWSDLPTTLSAFNQAKKAGILPDMDMYKALITACAKTGDYDTAYKIIDEAAMAALKVMKTGYWLQIALRLAVGAEVGKYTAIGLMGLVPNIGTTVPAGVGLTIGVIIGARLAVGTALREATIFLPKRTLLQRNIAEKGATRDQQVPTEQKRSRFGSLRDVIPKSDKDVRVELNSFMVNEFRRMDNSLTGDD